MCLYVYGYSGTTGYRAAYIWVMPAASGIAHSILFTRRKLKDHNNIIIVQDGQTKQEKGHIVLEPTKHEIQAKIEK